MSGRTKYTKRDFIKLVVSDLNANSEDAESAKKFLINEGVNVNKIVDEGLKRIKKIKMQIAASQTKKEMLLADKFTSKAIQFAEELLNTATFSIGDFMAKEKLALNFRNFESLSKEDIKEILIKHFTLKFMTENDSDTKSF
jgi:hypothetical protein